MYNQLMEERQQSNILSTDAETTDASTASSVHFKGMQNHDWRIDIANTEIRII